jgi:hypothetical protein
MRAGSPAFDELRGLLRDIVIATAAIQAAKAAAGVLSVNDGHAQEMRRAGIALQSIIDPWKLDETVRGDLSLDDFYLVVSNTPQGNRSTSSTGGST